MSTVNYEKLEKSLARLNEQYKFWKSKEETLSGNLKEAVQESVIQRFETCYDTLWKHMKKYLENEGRVDVPNSPKPIFRLAHDNGLIENLEDWLDGKKGYAQARIDTAHDYSMEKADSTLAKVGDFIEDAMEIYQTMTNGQ